VLCLQEDIADGVLHMLQGALTELRLGNPADVRWTSARSSTPRRATG
jgi:delta 1-pyrroline-5-carboxylate dehydrogenase